MSAICVLTPVVIGGWPIISAAVAGAAAALGLSLRKESGAAKASSVENEERVEVEVANSEIVAENLAAGEEMVLEQGGIRARVYRDERGRCAICVEGEGRTDQELRAFGEKLAGRITQMFVYNKVMTELKGRGFAIVDEKIDDDETVRLHVRRVEG